MEKRKGILELAENFLEKGFVWVEDKLEVNFSKKKKKKVQKDRKKQLKQEVDFLHDDLTKNERKGIVSEYYKKGITPPLSAEKRKQFVTKLEFEQRMKELEIIQDKEQTKELNR
jgi:GH24 family phage-related lysozyme (muramidase)